MPRIIRPSPGLLAGLTLAAALLSVPTLTHAQSAQAGGPTTPSRAAGMRVLTWPGKVERPAPGARLAAAARPAPVEGSPTRMRGPVAVYAQPTAPARNGLTPASAWLNPVPTTPTPTRSYEAAAPAHEAAPAYASVAATPPPPAAEPAPAPAAEAADPMAPRRDAPIFRMGATSSPASQAPTPNAYAPSSGPAPQGARYYSVHRAAGRQPDPTIIPEPFFLDHAPVDLAEPPAQPPRVRTADGRTQAAPILDEPTLP